MRDYNQVVGRVEATTRRGAVVETLGTASGYPILCATLSRDIHLPTVYINGGTHGDEPAGVEGALAFLEGDWEKMLGHLQFRVIPCLNPWGYVHARRENAQGVDINWAYERTDVSEIKIAKAFFYNRRFAAAVDLHEDWESQGFYVYELFRGRAIGHLIAKEVSHVCQLNTSPVIEGERAHHGVIHPNLEAQKRRGDSGIPIVLFRYRHTDRLITTETPTREPLAKRVEAQLATIDVVIRNLAHG
jgi:murein peptide amidase A